MTARQPAVSLLSMVESGSSIQDWERFKDQLEQVGEQIAQVARYLREGRGSREELASVLDGLSELVGTTLPDSLVISWGPQDPR
jgi:hypothetical protein